jgi:hypothetical protein
LLHAPEDSVILAAVILAAVILAACARLASAGTSRRARDQNAMPSPKVM